MIEIDNEIYYLDINSIIKWVLNSSSKQVKELEINEGYDINEEGDMELVTKIIRELKSTNNQDDTIRYDFIKLLINPFLGEINNKEDFKYNFSYSLLYNTLIEMGFLKKITK